MRGVTRLVAVGSIALLLAATATWKGIDVLAAQYGRTHTLEWRLDLWRDSVAPLREFFLFGSGLNTYGTLMLLYPQTDPTVHAQQAHNDYLELAIEGGVLVIVPWGIAAALLGGTIVRAAAKPQDETSWWVRMGAVAGICGIAVQEISDFSLQIPGVTLLFATLVALATHEPAVRAQEAANRMRPAGDSTATPAGRPAKLRLHSSRRLDDSRSFPSFPGR
jgi:O-antigen ligase